MADKIFPTGFDPQISPAGTDKIMIARTANSNKTEWADIEDLPISTATQAVLDTCIKEIADEVTIDASGGLFVTTSASLTGGVFVDELQAQVAGYGAGNILQTDINGNVTAVSPITLPVSTDTSAAIGVVQSDIDNHEARTDNPHSVTKAQVGLEFADNTSDVNKPISTATQTALDAKANLSGGNTFTGDQTVTGNVSADNIADTNYKNIYSDFCNKALNGDTLKIVCTGDSLTYGLTAGTGVQIANPYPLELQTKLRLIFKNNNITVVNKGVSGRKATDLVSAYSADVIAESPDLVIQMVGINDSNNSTTIDSFSSSINTLARNAIVNNFPTIFVTPTPIRRETTGAGNNAYRLDFYRKAVIGIADKYSIPYINMGEEFQSIFENSGGYTVHDFITHASDTLHPDQSGYIMIADIIIKNIVSTSEYKGCKGEIHIPLVGGLKSWSNNGTDIFIVAGNPYNRNYIFRKNTPGKYLIVPIFIGKVGMSLYANSCKNTAGTVCGVRDNGVLGVYSINFYNATLTSNIEDLLLSSIGLGIHILEINSDDFSGGDATGAQWYPTAFIVK